MPIDFPNSPTNGDTYSAGGKNWQYNGTAWVLQGVVPNVRLLDDIGDVNTPSPTDGYFLKYVSASSSWVAAAIPTINNLDDVGDVTITSATSGQFLKWNGSAWVNAAVSTDVMTDTKNAAIILMDIGA